MKRSCFSCLCATAVGFLIWCTLFVPCEAFSQVFTAITPPNAIAGEQYGGYIFRVSVTRPAFSLAPTSRPLPPGLRLNANGTLDGTATQVGTYSGIVIRAVSGSVSYDARPLAILVMPPTAPTFFAIEPITSATVGVATSLLIGRANGNPVPTYSLAPTSAALPEGLVIQGNRIVGQARRAGMASNIIIRASNRAGFVDSPPISLPVRANSVQSNFASPFLPFSTRIGVTGGTVNHVVQQNGFYILCGSFTHFDGRRVPGIVRISPEGRFDPTFSLRNSNGMPLSIFGGVKDVKLLPDDRLLVVGEIQLSDDYFGDLVVRLMPEGMIDTTYKVADLSFLNGVQSINTASDGSVYVLENFTGNIRRLNPDGSLDGGFNIPIANANVLRGIKQLSNGRLLAFSDIGVVQQYFPNGRLDTSFVSGVDRSLEVDVYDVVELEGGNLLVCAASRIYGEPVAYMTVLNPQGRVVVSSDVLQPLFAERNPDDNLFTIPKFGVTDARTALVMPDGKILLIMYAGTQFVFYRLNTDFTLDTSFQPRTGTMFGSISGFEFNEGVKGIFVDSETTACIFGNIASFDGVFQNGIIRINTTSPLTRITAQTPPPRATLGAMYPSYTFRADAEPSGFFTLAKYSSPLPPGMVLSTTGVLSGIPTTTGTFGDIFIRCGTRFVESAVTTSLSITVFPPEAPTNFLTQSLPSGVRTVTYATVQVQANGSPTPTYSLAPNSAPLPRGLQLSPEGVLSGTPAVTGVSNIIIRATNAIGSVDSPLLTLRIENITPPTEFRSVGQFPILRVGESFSYQMRANGSLPMAYSFADGSTTPPGLVITSQGVLTGIPRLSGTFPRVRIVAENTSGDFDTTFSVTVLPRTYNLSAVGNLDTTFTQTSAPNGEVRTVIRLQDSTYLLGGDFTRLGSRYVGRVGRLLRTGVVQAAFNPLVGTDTSSLGANASVRALAEQTDGKILVGGLFTRFNGAVQRGLVRLNADGSRDTTFLNNTPQASNLGIGNGEVNALAVQSDGRILVGGTFTFFNGRAVNRLVRLNANGTVDTAFTQNGLTGTDGAITTLKVLGDGRILVGGAFTSFLSPNPIDRRGYLRLNPNGALDTSLRIVRGIGIGNAVINDIDVQQDISLLAGAFTVYEGNLLNNLARVEATGNWLPNVGLEDGAREGIAFNVAPALMSLARRRDGRIIGVGNFTQFNSRERGGIAQFTSTGVLDTFNLREFGGFQTFPQSPTSGFPRQAVIDANDAAVIVGGGFTHYDGTPQPYLARIILRDVPIPMIIPFAHDKIASKAHDNKNHTTTSAIFNSQKTTSETSIHAYPNPFSESTVLHLRLAQSSLARLQLFDALGRMVTTLLEQNLDAGDYTIPLQKAQLPSSGVYYYRLQTASNLYTGMVSCVR